MYVDISLSLSLYLTETRRAHSAGPIKGNWYWYGKLREQIQGKKRYLPRPRLEAQRKRKYVESTCTLNADGDEKSQGGCDSVSKIIVGTNLRYIDKLLLLLLLVLFMLLHFNL